ncbi:MAG: tyrosine--tRNA ligase [Deltaproteobacteria bacterium]|nr:tyrosine--tRNA ligase [Deltaproteobacteria bacterium]
MQLKEQIEIIKRGAVEIIGEAELIKKLKKDCPLRIKVGFDPTAADLHLGHTVLLQKLRQFQDLGHEVLFLIGDFTASIGDPSGRNETRPPLSTEDIENNAATYKQQVFKILDPQKTKVVYNSQWLENLDLRDTIKLASKYTVARMLERNDFENRYHANVPISIHEFIYPLLQGYDSVILRADIELGGLDQKFNLLMGRHLQKEEGIEAQVVLMMPLLEGLSGGQKMSKSYNNYVGITEAPEVMFNKLMSISDDLMWKYYELLSARSLQAISEIKSACQSNSLNPRDAKIDLAKEIVTRFHSEFHAEKAKENFIRSFSEQEYETLPDIHLSLGTLELPLYKLVKEAGFAETGNEAKAKIKGGSISMNDQIIKDPLWKVINSGQGALLRGKMNKKRVEVRVFWA